ncbi:transporter substrate-binding domain-containing protein [Sphingobium sp. CR2-8]|uniref:transporter substrate-binding domain-containing protein n=1 Tax=Sphingobium sp. CR2-8 TaxID=1306534 RepID=UPI002DBB6110|nr:transporter substrate-binding domain-containing protein [Sphingobium sp. CR2-8]MEC3911451.1 transporter substrate-binding domain-containing protein [Sphingobium sp. CR2-8]
MRAGPAIALALMLADATGASAQDGAIRFGLTGDYPPYAQRLPDGSFEGADVVTARAVAKRLGKRAIFVPTSWQTLSRDFIAGRFDVVIGGLTITPERAAIGTYSFALVDDGKRPLARCADRHAYASLRAIERPGVRVQINTGQTIGALAKQWFSKANVTINPDDADLPQALLDGRADVWITDGVVVDHMARRYAGRLCATTRKPFTHQEKAWLIRRDAGLVAAVNAALRREKAGWERALRAVP